MSDVAVILALLDQPAGVQKWMYEDANWYGITRAGMHHMQATLLEDYTEVLRQDFFADVTEHDGKAAVGLRFIGDGPWYGWMQVKWWCVAGLFKSGS